MATHRRPLVAQDAPQVIIGLCHHDDFDPHEAQRQVEAFAEHGFRTLGVAYRAENEKAFHFVGLIPLFDPPREDSRMTIAALKKQGVEVKMITGDNQAVARYIAGLLDIGDNTENVRELMGESTEEYVMLARVISKALLKSLQSDIPDEVVKQKVDQIIALVKKELETTELPPGTVKNMNRKSLPRSKKHMASRRFTPKTNISLWMNCKRRGISSA